MKKIQSLPLLILVCCFVLTTIQTKAQETEMKPTDFGPIVSLIGKRFKGTPVNIYKDSKIDIREYEWDLAKSAIRVKHAYTDGSSDAVLYIYSHKDRLNHFYLTSTNYMSMGPSAIIDKNSWYHEEELLDHSRFDKVRSTYKINKEGHIEQYYSYREKNGNWKVSSDKMIYKLTNEDYPKTNKK
ncbi:hypothetical protein [Aquimarina algicola]|uniref:Uncharacterized protein n=1 Tax=Aquimarina algicola TaxID=2589995 RepID=A0A504J5Z7_9FLAO|nr:hypothetical protein [Aquimarina algicola]TPN86306.1 hypothetical protein FHK87_13650 [Aquimarina algicola]